MHYASNNLEEGSCNYANNNLLKTGLDPIPQTPRCLWVELTMSA